MKGGFKALGGRSKGVGEGGLALGVSSTILDG